MEYGGNWRGMNGAGVGGEAYLGVCAVDLGRAGLGGVVGDLVVLCVCDTAGHFGGCGV
jgi:hypothetical protein